LYCSPCMSILSYLRPYQQKFVEFKSHDLGKTDLFH
jgi:hypothetical protein